MKGDRNCVNLRVLEGRWKLFSIPGISKQNVHATQNVIQYFQIISSIPVTVESKKNRVSTILSSSQAIFFISR